MDKLHVFLMSPRSSVSLLDGATSTSMLRGDSEIECFYEELDGASDNDDILLSRMMFMAFFTMPCCTNSQITLSGFLAGRKTHKESIWKDKNCNKFSGIFREGSEAQIFYEWFVRSLDYEPRSMNLQMNWRFT
jgi:hypothetical protein